MQKLASENQPSAFPPVSRAQVRGKFFYYGKHKFFVKGVTYGTFAPHVDGHQFPDEKVVEKDFKLMVANGVNTVRTYTVPPLYLLDLAWRLNLKVMVGLPWEQHIAFLEKKETKSSIVRRLNQSVQSCQKHPSIFCYTIGNEIPATVVRWYGKQKIEKFLQELYSTVKKADPDALVTYVNYPTTEYLDLYFLDFICFNVYLESRDKLNSYLSKLHNLSGDLPLVLAEIGMDSMRNGERLQAKTLEWQTKMIYAKGCAGMFVFAWTDEWWRGGQEIEDWNFGIVDRQRNSKQALLAIRNTFHKVPFARPEYSELVSVVVCSFNGSATIQDCLEGLMKLHYPNYEIIVVNDGSTDNLIEIISNFPVQLINTPNQGLSNARNVGLHHAKGDIIVYIDDDAYPDPDWLNYLEYAFTHSFHAAIGGPNLVPAEDGFIAKCVASSPGGPTHVLMTDEIAEHIPGCNMAFRRNILLQIGGFDPVFKNAGDDVDICWRVQDAGYTIGFHSSALVWHHRRNSVKAYWKQQKGYGKAEALLEAKWPHRYNALGHYSWCGSIYGNGNTLPVPLRGKKIYYGSCGSALFQSVYPTADGLVSTIPLMPEWYLFGVATFLAGLLGMWWTPLLWSWALFSMTIVTIITQVVFSAWKNVARQHGLQEKAKYRLLISTLHFIQPVARLWGRIKHGLTPWRLKGAGFNNRFLFTSRAAACIYWSEHWHDPEQWLTAIENNLKKLNAGVKRGGDYDSWDIQLRSDLFSKIRFSLLIEEHAAGHQYVKLQSKALISGASVFLIALCTGLSAWSAADEHLLVSSILAVCGLLILWRLWSGLANVRHTLYCAFGKLQDINCIAEISETESAISAENKRENLTATGKEVFIFN